MKKPDVVYFVRNGELNEELRYSLRSLANLPHSKVWIVGYTPSWVTGVESIPGNVFRDKWWNVVDNLRLAAVHVPADRFVVMNDDIFLMRPPAMAPCYRGPLVEQIAKASGPWRDSLEKTYAYLASIGVDEPISYELHRPVLMEREKLLEVTRLALSWHSNPPQWRTLYGNLFKVGGMQVEDGKVSRSEKRWSEWDVLSTEDNLFRHHEVGRYIRSTFPHGSVYEQAPSRVQGPAPPRMIARRHALRPRPKPGMVQRVAV